MIAMSTLVNIFLVLSVVSFVAGSYILLRPAKKQTVDEETLRTFTDSTVKDWAALLEAASKLLDSMTKAGPGLVFLFMSLAFAAMAFGAASLPA